MMAFLIWVCHHSSMNLYNLGLGFHVDSCLNLHSDIFFLWATQIVFLPHYIYNQTKGEKVIGGGFQRLLLRIRHFLDHLFALQGYPNREYH